MKIVEFDQKTQNKIALYEGLDQQTITEALVWEDLGRSLLEAKLTIDQIDQLFSQIQTSATAAGDNQTKIGKAADVASNVGKKSLEYTKKAMAAFEDLKTAVANTDEMKAFDEKYDRVAEKLKQAVGGDDSSIMKAINYYREQAQKHPVLQGAAYAVAIGALGLSGAGLPGAAVLGLIKMGDRLLQGDKATASVWQGLKTAGITAAIGAARDYFKGASVPTPQTGAKVGGVEPNLDPLSHAYVKKAVATLEGMVRSGEITNYNEYQAALRKLSRESGVSANGLEILRKKIDLWVGKTVADANGGYVDGGSGNIIKKFIEMNGGTPDEEMFAAGEKFRQQMSGVGDDSGPSTRKGSGASSKTSEFEESLSGNNQRILETFNLIEISLAGLAKQGITKAAGAIKTGAEKALNKAGEIGSEYTQKITAAKLKKAWQAANSPTDSTEIYKILVDAGVPADVIKSAFKTQKVPLPKKSKPKLPVIKTSNPQLDDKVNDIIKTQGKDAAIKYLQDLKAASASVNSVADGTTMKASDGNTYKLSVGKSGDKVWLNTGTEAEASTAIDQELDKATKVAESVNEITRLAGITGNN